VTLAEGESATCTIINDDVAPTLTLVKQVVTDNGGTAVATDWNLTAIGVKAGNVLIGAGGATGNVLVDTFALSESTGPSGYTASDWVCVGGTQNGASVTLAEGESATCTITNDDVAPGLTLVKQVVNDDGGTAVATDWDLTATGAKAGNVLSGAGGATGNVLADTFALSESTGPAGYTAGDWVCVGGTQNGASVTLAEGESATCTITNDDVAPTLTLVKVVDGGNALPDDFSLTVDGNLVLSGESNEFDANLALAINETLLPGYDFVSITGDDRCPATLGGTITLDLGDDATCTITNAYRPPPPTETIPVPVNNPLALFLLTLLMLATGWHFRPGVSRKY
jgi:hypothetical protein